MIMERKEYNGWTNYETWLVKLWLDNDQGAAEYWEEEAREAMQDVVEKDTFSADDLRNSAAYDLADRLKDWHENYVEEVMPSPAGFLNDLINSALSEVNWEEIARHYVEEIDVYVVGWNMPGYMPDSDNALFLDFEGAQESLKESFESHAEEDENTSEEQMVEILDGIDAWKESGNGWSFTWGNYVYWIEKQ